MINTINPRQRFPYWCHSCMKETFPTENESGSPVCGFCRNSFIEEINSYNHDRLLEQSREANRQPNLIQTSIIPPQERRAQSVSRQPNNRISSIILYRGNRDNGVITYSISNLPLNGQNRSITNLLDNPILSLLSGNNNPLAAFLSRHSDGDAAFENFLNILMQNDPNRYGSPPASPSEIQELKKEKIDNSNLNKFEGIECSVCKDKYEIDNLIVTMPCTHVFHTDCLLPWLDLHNSCPVCRYELKTEDPEYENRKKELRRTLNNSHNSHNSENENNTSDRNRGNIIYPRRSGSQQPRRR
jgi:E3 ubiquitin-protein ligase RNF115/126